jgi:hypothetical protein
MRGRRERLVVANTFPRLIGFVAGPDFNLSCPDMMPYDPHSGFPSCGSVSYTVSLLGVTMAHCASMRFQRVGEDKHPLAEKVLS